LEGSGDETRREEKRENSLKKEDEGKENAIQNNLQNQKVVPYESLI
jgi:hypothetical protein